MAFPQGRQPSLHCITVAPTSIQIAQGAGKHVSSGKLEEGGKVIPGAGYKGMQTELDAGISISRNQSYEVGY